MFNKTFDVFTIFFIGLIIFTVGLSSQEIIGFESRFYLFALEMWRHGASWFPTTYQKPYPDYPVTATYLIYLTSYLWGHLNKLTAVLPSAMVSAMTLSVTYLIGRLHSRQWGWCAVFLLLFTLTFITEARTISLDQYITLITALCFYLLEASSMLEGKKARVSWLIIPLLVLGFAIRGPIGVVIPTGVMCIFYLLDKNIKQFFTVGLIAVVILGLGSAILLAIAYHAGGESFVQDVIRMEIAGRMNDESMPPISFYFTESFGGYVVTYPLAILILIGCIPSLFTKKISTDMRFLRKCLGWIVVILIGLSIPADKKMRYILPIAPALALTCAYLFVGFQKNRYLQILHNIFNGILFLFPLIALLGVLFLYQKHIALGLNYSFLIILFSVLQIAIFVIRKNRIGILGLAALTFFVANVFIIEVINLYMNRTREFVLQVEQLRKKFHTPLVFFQEGSDGLPIKYLVSMPTEESPVYLDQPTELLSLKPRTFVIVGAENFPHIPADILRQYKVILRNKIGHDVVVVVEKNPSKNNVL